VIPVAAVDDHDVLADFSNYGYGITVVAPGVDIASCVTDGQNKAADIVFSDTTILARGLKGSPFGSATGHLIDSKLGYPEDFPASVAGNIALIKRGDFDFREKVRNAKNAGATAVVIWNNREDDDVPEFNLVPHCDDPNDAQCPEEWRGYQFLVTMNIKLEDGLKLLTLSHKTATVSYFSELYARKKGTSMASPYVAASAALVLALAPGLKPVDIDWLLRRTARDLGEPGWSYDTSYGMVDALAAAKYVAPDRFGLPQQQPPITKRRSSRP